MTYNCDQCGKGKTVFRSAYNKSKNHFCSHECYIIHREENRSSSNKVKCVCDGCGNEFYKKLNQHKATRAHYCSRECFCKNGEKDQIMRDRISKAMTGKKYPERSGENHPNWNPDTNRHCIDCGKKYKHGQGSQRCMECYRKYSRGKNHPSWKGGITLIIGVCDWCGEELIQRADDYKRAGHHFCDKQCEGKWNRKYRRGENAAGWQGGKTALHSQIRNSFQYKQWRKDVFERDNYECQDCYSRSRSGEPVYIEVHHKKQMAVIIKQYNIVTFEEALECEELWNADNGKTLCKDCHNKQDHTTQLKIVA